MKFNMSDTGATLYSWLTLTWDVLKSQTIKSFAQGRKRLTLTWDVLKYKDTQNRAEGGDD